MALGTEKKANIIADWKTGDYTKNALSKKHKISPSTCGILVAGIEQTNKTLVAQAIVVEEEKSKINRKESNAVDSAVKRYMKNVKLVETIVDLGLNATAHNLAEIHRDVTTNKKLGPTERSTHQRTLKMGIETARLAMGGSNPEEKPEADYDVTPNEISAAIADGLPD